MYIENIRKTIKTMTDEQYDQFLIKLRKKLKNKFNTDIKPSALKKQVDNFLENKTDKISIRYLEGYLLVLDDLSVNGGLKSILQGKITEANTWRDLLIIATQDQPLPKNININNSNNILIKDIKLLFTNVIKYCADENKDKFHNNIHKVNEFLTIKKDLEK